MARSVSYKCPACTGPLAFDAQLGKLHCEYCGSSYTAEEVEAFYAAKQEEAEAQTAKEEQREGKRQAKERAEQAAGAAVPQDAPAQAPQDPIQAYLDSKRPLNEGDAGAKAVKCSSCGATMIVSDVSAVTQCPYCSNNNIVAGALGDTLEPDLVIPFSTTKEQAVSALKSHYNGKVCLPAVFKDQNHIEEVQGIYVPFWLYSGSCQGDAAFTATDSITWSDSDNIYTKTSTYRCTRSGSCSFEMVPADASKRMPNQHMDSIEPYDYSAFKSFSMGYLPGFAAERYDDTVEDCANRVSSRMQNTLEDELERTVTGHDTCSKESMSAHTQLSDVNYALLPVWMLHTRWNGEDFLFAMNGQTGKLVGDLPCDEKKLRRISLLSGLGTFAVVFGIMAAMILL
ncbi:MAG: hypothetical protein ACI36W_03595 [Coriobacteriales bacterium]